MEQLCAATNCAFPLLTDTRKETSDICNDNKWNSKCIAGANEARRFLACCRIENSANYLWIICNHTYGAATEATNNGGHILGPHIEEFEFLAIFIENRIDEWMNLIDALC